MVNAAFSNTCNMFINPDGKYSNSATYILHVTRARYKIHNKASSTCCELFHVINSRSRCSCKALHFSTPPGIVYTHIALTKGIEPLEIREKR